LSNSSTAFVWTIVNSERASIFLGTNDIKHMPISSYRGTRRYDNVQSESRAGTGRLGMFICEQTKRYFILVFFSDTD